MIERALAWLVALFFVRIDPDIPSYLMTEYRNDAEIGRDATKRSGDLDPLWHRLRQSSADGDRLTDVSEESAAD